MSEIKPSYKERESYPVWVTALLGIGAAVEALISKGALNPDEMWVRVAMFGISAVVAVWTYLHRQNVKADQRKNETAERIADSLTGKGNAAVRSDSKVDQLKEELQENPS